MKNDSSIKLSATRISTFLQCKLRYWYAFVDKKEKLENINFKFGLAVHTALEFAGNLIKGKENPSFSKDDIKNILGVYTDASIKQGIEDYEVHVVGRDLVKNRLKNFLIGDRVIDVELKFGFDNSNRIYIDKDKKIELIGAIDKVEVIDDTNTVIVIDYKTLRTAPDKDKLDTDIQLSMYDYAIRKIYPKYDNVLLCLDLLRKNKYVYTYRTYEQYKEFKEYLLCIYDNMSSLTKSDVKPRLNSLCGWCDFSNICEAFKEVCNTNYLKDEVDLVNCSDQELIEEWERITTNIKVLSSRENIIKNKILDKLKFSNVERIEYDDQEYYIRQNVKSAYNTYNVLSQIPVKDIPEVVTVSPTKLKKYLNDNTYLKDIIDNEREINFTRPFIGKRKLKK